MLDSLDDPTGAREGGHNNKNVMPAYQPWSSGLIFTSPHACVWIYRYYTIRERNTRNSLVSKIILFYYIFFYLMRRTTTTCKSITLYQYNFYHQYCHPHPAKIFGARTNEVGSQSELDCSKFIFPFCLFLILYIYYGIGILGFIVFSRWSHLKEMRLSYDCSTSERFPHIEGVGDLCLYTLICTIIVIMNPSWYQPMEYW